MSPVESTCIPPPASCKTTCPPRRRCRARARAESAPPARICSAAPSRRPRPSRMAAPCRSVRPGAGRPPPGASGHRAGRGMRPLLRDRRLLRHISMSACFRTVFLLGWSLRAMSALVAPSLSILLISSCSPRDTAIPRPICSIPDDRGAHCPMTICVTSQ